MAKFRGVRVEIDPGVYVQEVSVGAVQECVAERDSAAAKVHSIGLWENGIYVNVGELVNATASAKVK